MSDNPSPREAPPPPPPPRKSKTGLTIGIVAGVIVVCLCCVAGGVAIYFERDQIASLFPSATPEGVLYNNDNMGISLRYPTGWILEESEGGVVFASSQEIIDSNDFPASGAGFIVLRDQAFLLAFTGDVSTPTAILEQIADPASGFLGEAGDGMEPARSFTVQGYPAASAPYPVPSSIGGTDLVEYVIVILPDDTPLIIIGVCPQSEWTMHRPTFDGILTSLEIRPAR